jgi:hypothetical protein
VAGLQTRSSLLLITLSSDSANKQPERALVP